MNISLLVFELLKLIIPSLFVLAAVYFLVQKFFDNDQKLRLLELKKAAQPIVLPLRFQAYERICVFLERITPNSLVMRSHHSGISARDLQADLLTTIRSEFDHNLSQQVFMSSLAWEQTKMAKEEVVKIINLSMASLPENATGIQLCKNIFEIVMKTEVQPTQRALDLIKNEIKTLL
jgi:hypothetical protein